ncbi:M48 family metallopeptidase [Aliamphritea spongicola]|uniref:M48 family metallopeptidase n=1 Tax=Aliamphritea spongicola TaxID=707589 RepID=UPI00196B3202|nr:SprT family zinc-dependent metalloprotease [Aliamphritea spongicola]MBN3560668.1 M48 family metallopeptidase [Aliamphritea spongicola]
MDYQLRRSNRRKTVEIQVRPEGVRVLAPQHISQRWIDNFVASRRVWIETRHAELQRQLQLIEAHKAEITEASQVLYRGSAYPLKVLSDADQSQVCFSDGVVTIQISRRVRKSKEEACRQLLETWLRQQAVAIFEERVAEWSGRMALFPASIKVKSFRRKWGCCDSRAEVRFNWLLIMAPDEVLNYVVIHELAHLKHMNHSAAFWILVSRYCPDYKRWQNWLKQQGATLVLP